MLGDALGDATGRRAVDEGLALRLHLGLDLLAHGAAQQIGAAQRVAAEHLRDLHHLLLVDHDPMRFRQDRLERGVEIVRPLLAVLHRDVARDVLHRPRAIERVHGDDVLEAVGTQLAQHVAHARTFELEHADRVAAPQQLEGSAGRRAGARARSSVTPRACSSAERARQHGQGLEAEEVELHQPGDSRPI